MQSGIFNRITLGQYYRDLEKISKYLAKHRRVNDWEQDRPFLQGFGETTSKRIEAWIAITNQQHHPDDPYLMAEVQKAVEWLLASTTTTGAVGSIGSNPGVSITVSGTTSNGPRNSRTAQGDPIGDSNISSADSDDDITIRIRIRATGLSGH